MPPCRVWVLLVALVPWATGCSDEGGAVKSGDGAADLARPADAGVGDRGADLASAGQDGGRVTMPDGAVDGGTDLPRADAAHDAAAADLGPDAWQPTTEWIVRGAGNDGDEASSVAVDTAGNSYLVGSFAGSMQWASTTLTSTGEYDPFVVKLDPQGNALWALSFAGATPGSWEHGIDLAVDDGGNVYVVGSLTDSITIGGETLSSQGASDLFLAKIDSQGTPLWAKRFGGDDADTCNGIAVDPDGQVTIVGAFVKSIAFGTTVLDAQSTPGSGDHFDLYVARLDGDGAVIWARSAGSPTGGDHARDVAVDGAGNSYVTGQFCGTATFGSAQIVSTVSPCSGGGTNLFVSKIDGAGSFVWTRAAGGSKWDSGSAIAVDASGNSYLTGFFTGLADFGTHRTIPVAYRDVFVARLDAAGNFQWVASAGGPRDDVGDGIVVDAAGRVYVTGQYVEQATFGDTVLDATMDWNIFVTELDSAGRFVRAGSAGGRYGDVGQALVLHGSRLLVTGYFTESAEFSGQRLSSGGPSDAYDRETFLWSISTLP